MRIEQLTKADYDQILGGLLEFWPTEFIRAYHHPLYLYEFGDTAFVMRDGDRVAAYLLGFIATARPVAYVHLVGVREPYRKRGLAGHLYRRFMDGGRERGCTALKAITTPGNTGSIAFHRAMGMELEGDTDPEFGYPVVRDYSGPGQHRVVFQRSL